MFLIKKCIQLQDSASVEITEMANSGKDQIATVQIGVGQLKTNVSVKLPPIKEWHQGGFALAIVNAINATISSNLVQVARVNNNGIEVSKELFRTFAEKKNANMTKAPARRKSIYKRC